LRSLILTVKLLKCQEIFVIQHSDCAMQKFKQCTVDELFKESLVVAELVENCNLDWQNPESSCKCQWENTVICGGAKNCEFDWMAINHGLIQSVTHDVKKIRRNKFIPSYIPIY